MAMAQTCICLHSQWHTGSLW